MFFEHLVYTIHSVISQNIKISKKVLTQGLTVNCHRDVNRSLYNFNYIEIHLYNYI